MPAWNPHQYLKFAAERTQPCRDLAARIAVPEARRIIDLGCGPGNSTAVLRARWPQAEITGLDSSAEMIERASREYPHHLWIAGGIAEWAAGGIAEWAAGGKSESAAGGISESAAGGKSESAAGGISEWAAGGISEWAAGGIAESAAGGKSESAAGGISEWAAGGIAESAAGGKSESAAGGISESAAAAGEPYDIVFSNAALQWVEDHARLYPQLLSRVAPAGALAIQIPGNIDALPHRLMRETAASPPWSPWFPPGKLREWHHHEMDFYYDVLAPHAARLDLWATEYLHILPDVAAIVEWYKSTGLRPFLNALESDAARERFMADYLARLRPHFPPRPAGGVLFPFRRLFLIAYRTP